MEPATSIIAKLGGAARVSEITGINVSNVHRWTYPKTRGGTGGVIPVKHWPTLFHAAEEMQLDIGPADLVEQVSPHPNREVA